MPCLGVGRRHACLYYMCAECRWGSARVCVCVDCPTVESCDAGLLLVVGVLGARRAWREVLASRGVWVGGCVGPAAGISAHAGRGRCRMCVNMVVCGWS